MNITDGKYPVIGTKPQEYIPYEVLIPHEERAMKNHGGQTLQRLAERGGLSWYEILCILENVTDVCKKYDDVNINDCKRKVWKHILKYYNYQQADGWCIGAGITGGQTE